MGAHALGVYSVGTEIAVMPSTELIAPLNRAVYPAYARLSRSISDLLARFLQVFGIICLVAFPVSVGLVCVAPVAVPLFLGRQWVEAVPIVQLVSISGLAGALQSNLYLVIVALGKPKANTVLSAAILALSLPLVVYASLRNGAMGAALAHAIVAIVGLIGIVLVFKRITGLQPATLLTVVWRPMVASALMATTVMLYTTWLAALPRSLTW